MQYFVKQSWAMNSKKMPSQPSRVPAAAHMTAEQHTFASGVILVGNVAERRGLQIKLYKRIKAQELAVRSVFNRYHAGVGLPEAVPSHISVKENPGCAGQM